MPLTWRLIVDIIVSAVKVLIPASVSVEKTYSNKDRTGHLNKDGSCRHWSNCWPPNCPTRRRKDGLVELAAASQYPVP